MAFFEPASIGVVDTFVGPQLMLRPHNDLLPEALRPCDA